MMEVCQIEKEIHFDFTSIYISPRQSSCVGEKNMQINHHDRYVDFKMMEDNFLVTHGNC